MIFPFYFKQRLSTLRQVENVVGISNKFLAAQDVILLEFKIFFSHPPDESAMRDSSLTSSHHLVSRKIRTTL
jgi:hypothetical protein